MLRKRHRSIFLEKKNAFTANKKKTPSDIVLQDIFFPFSYPVRPSSWAQEINNLWDNEAENIDFLLIMEQICTFHIRFLCTHQVNIYIQRDHNSKTCMLDLLESCLVSAWMPFFGDHKSAETNTIREEGKVEVTVSCKVENCVW